MRVGTRVSPSSHPTSIWLVQSSARECQYGDCQQAHRRRESAPGRGSPCCIRKHLRLSYASGHAPNYLGGHRGSSPASHWHSRRRRIANRRASTQLRLHRGVLVQTSESHCLPLGNARSLASHRPHRRGEADRTFRLNYPFRGDDSPFRGVGLLTPHNLRG